MSRGRPPGTPKSPRCRKNIGNFTFHWQYNKVQSGIGSPFSTRCRLTRSAIARQIVFHSGREGASELGMCVRAAMHRVFAFSIVTGTRSSTEFPALEVGNVTATSPLRSASRTTKRAISTVVTTSFKPQSNLGAGRRHNNQRPLPIHEPHDLVARSHAVELEVGVVLGQRLDRRFSQLVPAAPRYDRMTSRRKLDV